METTLNRRGRVIGHCLFVALLLLLVLAACDRGAGSLSDVTVDLAVEPQPPQVGPAAVLVTLTGSGGRLLSGAQVELEGNMSHAGMVPVFATAAEVEPGRYRGELEFTMAGDWFIVVRATLADGRSLEEKVDVPRVGDR